MKKLTRTLLALALASSAVQLAACGDDNDSSGLNGDGDGDGDTKTDGGPGDGDTDHGDASTGDGDGGMTETVVVLDKCPTDSHITQDDANKVCRISAAKGNEIKTNLTLSKVKGFKGYAMEGLVYVGEDVGAAAPEAGKARATLTITPGTVIAGVDNTSGLAVNRGSKLEAAGTPANPIEFTSVTAMLGGAGAPTDWGGIVLMGRATQNKAGSPVTELNTGLYGGTDDADSSGTLKYVRVLFRGSRATPEKEFNGVSFYAVGSGTTVDYVEVHAGSDDSFEFFGGAVNAKHLVSSGAGDDNFDWTDGFHGKLQFLVAKQVANFGDNGIEADNQKGMTQATPVSEPTISNLSLLGDPTGPDADGNSGLFMRVGTGGHIHNALVSGFKKACVNVVDADTQARVGNALTIANTRILCAPDNFRGTGEQAFTSGTNNMVLASAPGLNGFLPKEDSGLLTGGTKPADAFFEDAAYIGAFGTVDWTAGWTVYPAFEPK